MATASTIIADLPIVILQGILSYLTYAEISAVSAVSTHFSRLSETSINVGVAKVLKILRRNLRLIETSINGNVMSLEKKMRLNQSYTVLEMVGVELHSYYVKNRCCMNSEFARFLDEVLATIKIMDINNLSLWSKHSTNLQIILTKFNMQKMSISQQIFILPLGVHFMELLDLSIELSYEIECIYNLQDRTCSILGRYYTDHIKVSSRNILEQLYQVDQFVSLSPDVFYLTDCTDRRIDLIEGEGILKYLSFLVNMYNCMFCKSEEYGREMRLREGREWVAKKLHTIQTRRCFSRKVDGCVVVETYRRSLEEDGDKHVKGLLSCQIYLKCNLSEAPYQISRNYDDLKNHILFECDNDEIQQNNISSYGVEVKLRLELHKHEGVYEVVFKDGLEV